MLVLASASKVALINFDLARNKMLNQTVLFIKARTALANQYTTFPIPDQFTLFNIGWTLGNGLAADIYPRLSLPPA